MVVLYFLRQRSKQSLQMLSGIPPTYATLFQRPMNSHFSRKQRLSCCVSAMFLTMVANAMWFGTEEDAPQIGVQLGPINLTVSSVAVRG